MPDFVNPYTFVPLPSEVRRSEPPGHVRLVEKHYSGTLQVSMTARTPLLVRGFGSTPDPGGTVRDRLPRRGNGQVFIPGSSLHGAFRSLHETIAGGCLRVVDLDFVPVHREVPTAATTRDFCLAVVSKIDQETGRPTQILLASEEAWFDRNRLVAGLGVDVRTSQLFTHHGGTPRTARGRTVYSDGTVQAATARTPSRWLLLVTDTRARSGSHPVYFVAGRGFSESVGLTDGAWFDYLDCVEDADDMHRFRPGNAAGIGEFAPVGWPPPTSPVPPHGTVFGERRTARASFKQGQPVWVRVAGGEVTEIKLSVVWRHLGRGTVRKRVPPDLRPCDDPKWLCASCRVFGSADIEAREGDASAVQSSYRGHVRFGDALPTAALEAQPWHLAPLGAPKFSAGQFYLDHSGVSDAKKTGESGKQPRATWGSATDTDQAGKANFRPMRGRKFYWRTSSPTGDANPRGRARDGQSPELTKHVELIPTDTDFNFTVSYENLDLAGLGGLLAALQPGLVLNDGPGTSEIVTSVGGGKPFGFGAVTTSIELTSAQTAESRYLGTPAQSLPAIDDAVTAFRGAVGREARQGWPGIRRVLTLDAVADSDVWYPIGTGQRGTESYDEAFDFWQASSGRESHGIRTRLVGPPPLTAPDQRMSIANTTAPAQPSRESPRERGRRR